MTYNMPTTEYLIDRLKADISLRRICGWESVTQVPSASAF
ncbi:MAG: IS5/IS1182 family transposase, partial [Chlamydiota bacterium]